jgi:hypothetical protein
MNAPFGETTDTPGSHGHARSSVTDPLQESTRSMASESDLADFS